MDLPALYDDDMHAWALHQAAVLRSLRASGTSLPNDLDLEHVAEEIQCLGNEQRFQVEGNLEQALAHLIKMALHPDDPAVRHRSKEVVAFLNTARRRYRRSMDRALELDDLWSAARRAVRAELDLARGEPRGLPAGLPFPLADLLDPEAEPRALATRLAAMIAAADEEKP